MINNQFYEELGDDWLHRNDHPIALLRAENKLRAPWIAQEISNRLNGSVSVLDIGCGAGLLSNRLAAEGHRVTGIDISPSSLMVAKKTDTTRSALYLEANAYSIPFANGSFDVVCAMDVLEHVEEPSLLIAEASRLLKPHGLFFFHTFNRNFLSYLAIIKGVDWLVPNAPSSMHVYPLFIKPRELEEMCSSYHLFIDQIRGFEPVLFSKALVKMVFQRTVPPDFRFRFTNSLRTGYCGIAKKL